MKNRINLAAMQKKEDQALKIEMADINAVGGEKEGCPCDEVGIWYNDTASNTIYDRTQGCDCASIWVVFGLSI